MAPEQSNKTIDRREFVAVTLVSGFGLQALQGREASLPGEPIGSGALRGDITVESGQTPIAGAKWYVARTVGDGITYTIPQGRLAGAKMLTADMLLDGNRLIVFLLTLQEGDAGRAFHFRFSGLNQCSFRVRMPLSLVDQNRWGIDREGAFLKPRCSGSRVDLAKVDRIRLEVYRKSPDPARWCMTPLLTSDDEVPTISRPLLPRGPLLDDLGQSRIHDWPGKSRSSEEVVSRIRAQLEAAPRFTWPQGFSRWGGWKAKRIGDGTGFFRTHKEGDRWWLVDPDGYAFWSTGLDCVRVDTRAQYDGLESALSWLPDPEGEFRDIYDLGTGSRRGKSINYLAANFIRSFGPTVWREKWAEIALAELRRLGFNTVANWSEWNWAKQSRFPYVRPLSFRRERTANIYRDFPDVYHPDFEKEAADFAGQLAETADDPAFIGYFLMNEPTWGFSSEFPAAGMLFNTPTCATREELSRFLKQRYSEASALSRAWGMDTSFGAVATGRWTGTLTEAALEDLEAFSSVMVERYFSTLSRACRSVDPHHLNLGMRWAGPPPSWAVRGMKSFDVFSLNCYREKLPVEVTDEIRETLGLPVIIGEWHFGALDVGLPSSGIGHLKNQVDRAKAYRVYLEDAAANPDCVGAHWFTLYDESALGRFDGENYNIGFLDVCNRPYPELCRAARASHERVYELAEGRATPFNDVPEYLPKLY